MSSTLKLSNGKVIPALAWGNGSSGLTASGEMAATLGAAALQAGLTHIDTAQMYFTEAETGEAIRNAGVDRVNVWITTKISESSNTKTTLDDVRRSVTQSISRLGSIPNLLLIHNPFVPEEGRIGEFWTYLETLVMDGTLEGCSLGFSNFRPQDIEEVMKVATIAPVCHQLEYHPYVLAHLEPVLALHRKHNIVAEAYGPLTPILRHPGGPLRPVLDKIAKRNGSDAGTVLLQWIIQSGAVAVTTSTRSENIRKLAKLFDQPELSQPDMQDIEEAGRSVHYRFYSEHMTKDFPNPALPDGK
ncbi:NAD/NADP-dependent indole-3-acetaldehyde reductase [Vanrija pseudolonga]|uniref:NAD/NADP-dependent indole-3-acetaldehyde reductase n=1 Tax=Vanrija pseudolonga TaxID=143232 RepID=A0AAF0Y4R3_9TREE|nr:NAD/NADP-dependent indole-3-acetaldehyde reductase [Vanrija pseudolonga]